MKITTVESIELEVTKAENGFIGKISAHAGGYYYWTFVGSDLDDMWNAAKDKIFILLTQGVSEEEDESHE